MPIVDLLLCPSCGCLRKSTRRQKRCGRATINGICRSRLTRRRAETVCACIESSIAFHIDASIAAKNFADRVDDVLAQQSVNLWLRSDIRAMFEQDIESALHYHRGDHGGNQPMSVVCVIDSSEIRFDIRGHSRSRSLRTSIAMAKLLSKLSDSVK